MEKKKRENYCRKFDFTSFKIFDRRIPTGFNGCRILQISDLHNRLFGNRQRDLIMAAQRAEPDFIFITGDLIDRNKTDVKAALDFMKAACRMAPVYYVTGNHEFQAGEPGRMLMEKLEKLGVFVLRGQEAFLQRGEDRILVIGIDDPYAMPVKYCRKADRPCAEDYLRRLKKLASEKKDAFTILLAHRPEFFSFYVKTGMNLVFSGHAHGGQFRFPVTGGLLAPHQGFFPRYAEGMIDREDTKMIVSRGLGNSLFPFRVNNRPELILVTLFYESVCP